MHCYEEQVTLSMENIRAIRDDNDLKWALKVIEPYFDTEPEVGSKDDDRFIVLATLIAAYEAEHYPIVALDPVTMIATYMAQQSLKNSDLAQLVGSRSRASEILGRKRALTLGMINAIADQWKLPLADLAKPYSLAGTDMAA
jgi:HTH-type transcriptional regulator / antitoxin HigA